MQIPAGLWRSPSADSGSQLSLTCIQIMFGNLALGQRGFCYGFEDEETNP